MVFSKCISGVSLLGVSLLMTGCPLGGGGKPNLESEENKVSYIIGFQIGSNLRQDSLTIDQKVFLAGLNQGLDGGESLISQEEATQVMTSLQANMQEKAAAKQKEDLEKNAGEGEKFLAENAKKEGVVVLESGLQYKVIEEGSGESPKATDTVVTNYRGTLIDGTEFDSSYKRGEPAKFPVNRVIQGWTEALQLMKPGAKWELYVPSDLAYGASGAGGMIGPNATLIFEIELIGLDKDSEN